MDLQSEITPTQKLIQKSLERQRTQMMIKSTTHKQIQNQQQQQHQQYNKKIKDEDPKVATGVRIETFIFQSATQQQSSSLFCIFVDTTGVRWKGILSRADKAHEYDIWYKIQRDEHQYGRQRTTTINQIVHVAATRRIPMTKNLISNLLVTTLGWSLLRANRTLMSATGGASEHQFTIFEIINIFGTCKWYNQLEVICQCIVEWYTDALCPPLERTAITSLTPKNVITLTHMAIKTPWMLCFWWMSPHPLLDELSVDQVNKICTKVGHPRQLDALTVRVIEAYRGAPYGTKRSKGKMSVSMAKACASIGEEVVQESIKLGVVALQQHRLIFVGDTACEEAIAERILTVVTTGDDGDCRRTNVPVGAALPFTLNEEQQDAVYAALASRFHVITGKPGTGKTSAVMRALFQSFARGTVLPVAFTGLAAQTLRKVLRSGATAHKVVHSMHRGCNKKYSGKHVLIIEEASTMSLRLLNALIAALGSSLRRIYIFGDHRQMPPTDGWVSVIGALVSRYQNTPMVTDLTVSMRIHDDTGILTENLDAINDTRVFGRGFVVASSSSATSSKETITQQPPTTFSWSDDPRSRHPFIFLQRGASVADDVTVIRDALIASGVDISGTSKAPDWQIMVADNATRREFGRLWFSMMHRQNTVPCDTTTTMEDEEQRTSSPTAIASPIGVHEFAVGERVMFTRNIDKSWKPQNSKHKSAVVMNGTIGRVTKIIDENPCTLDTSIPTPQRTSTPLPSPTHRRWLEMDDGDYEVCLSRYGADYMEHIPPATVDKMQGQEADVCVLLIRRPSIRLGRCGIYTACSRARRRVIVVADFNIGAHGPCPSEDFYASIIGDSRCHTQSFASRLPPASTFSALTRSVLLCAVTNSSDNDEDEDTDTPTQPKKKRRCHVQISK